MPFWVKEIKTPSNAYSRPSVHVSGPFATHEEADALAQSLTRRGAWSVDGEVIEADSQPAASMNSTARRG